MHVETADYRPTSALHMRVLGAVSIVSGMFTASLGAGLFVVVALSSLGTVSLDALDASDIADAPEFVEERIIEAAFVQLGRPFDPRELPDRQTATSTFARRRPDPNAVSMNTRAEVDAGPQPLNPHVSEQLAQLGNRSELFNPSNFVPERDGELEGMEEGRESEGSIYAGLIQSMLRRGFNMPESIPDTERAGLAARVTVVVGPNLRFQSIRISTPSGNGDFDRAVERRLAEVRESDPVLPEPSASDRELFIGQNFTVRFVPPGGGRQRPTRTPRGGSTLDNLGAGYP